MIKLITIGYRMELRHLRYFVAAAEAQHFGKAARKLGIVQPALSKQVKELEEELGVPLFERLPRGVRLTAAGASFQQESVALLQQLSLAADKARSVAKGQLGCLRLGFVDTAMNHPGVPALVGRFRREHPTIKLELTQAPSVTQWELLRSNRTDAGLLYHLPEQDAQLESLVLGEERIMLAVPRSHPCARRATLRMADLSALGFVWMPRSISPPFDDAVKEACRKHGFEMKVVQEAGTDHAIMSMVAAGAGVTFCISSAMNARPRDVRIVPIRDLNLRFKLRLCWLRGHANPALSVFIRNCHTLHAANSARRSRSEDRSPPNADKAHSFPARKSPRR